MDPNATLRDLRTAIEATRTSGHHPETVRQAAADAADHAADLVDWLDRGGFLPNDWQPFKVANTDAEPETFDAAGRAALLRDDLANLSRAEADWQITAALQAAYDCGTDDRSPTQGERDLQADYDRQREELAAFAKSLGDCNTDRCNMAIALAKANRERDQAIAARDKALSMARDEGLAAERRIDMLTRDLAHAQDDAATIAIELRDCERMRDVAERDRQFAQSEADQLRGDLAATLSTLEGRVAEEMTLPADRHQRNAWALLAREAASIARMGDLVSGDHRAVKVAADLHQRRNGDDFAQLAAMLAVGAARYASRRRSPDTAARTADHLDHLADRITNQQRPAIEDDPASLPTGYRTTEETT